MKRELSGGQTAQQHRFRREVDRRAHLRETMSDVTDRHIGDPREGFGGHGGHLGFWSGNILKRVQRWPGRHFSFEVMGQKTINHQQTLFVLTISLFSSLLPTAPVVFGRSRSQHDNHVISHQTKRPRLLHL